MKKVLAYLILFCIIALPLYAGWDDASPFQVRGDLTTYQTSTSLADDANITFTTGVAGFGQVMAGNGEEWMQVHFTSAGVVTKVSGTTNTSVTDSDTDLCVFDAGDGIKIRNRLGSTKDIRLFFSYSK